MTYIARYYRYQQEMSEELDSLEAAIAFLAAQWDAGQISERDILGPDGAVVLEGEELLNAMTSSWA